MGWEQNIREYIEFLKQKHNLTDAQIREELFGDKLPLAIFATQLTPLQAAAKYLSENLKRTPKDIATTLGRSTAEIEKFLAATTSEPPLPTTSRYSLPAALFADRNLSASEHIVAYLQKHHSLSVGEIAALLNKAEQTVWTLHYRIAKKGGEKQ
jgi:DNA-binding CsgD family transcriptional regulator